MNWFFTGNAQVIHSKIKAMQATIDVWEAFVPANARHMQRLEMQIDVLREEIADHKAALHKLRGQVHGPKAQEPEFRSKVRGLRVEDAPALTPKDELRRRAGIIAGRPAPHTQEIEDE